MNFVNFLLKFLAEIYEIYEEISITNFWELSKNPLAQWRPFECPLNYADSDGRQDPEYRIGSVLRQRSKELIHTNQHGLALECLLNYADSKSRQDPEYRQDSGKAQSYVRDQRSSFKETARGSALTSKDQDRHARGCSFSSVKHWRRKNNETITDSVHLRNLLRWSRGPTVRPLCYIGNVVMYAYSRAS